MACYYGVYLSTIHVLGIMLSYSSNLLTGTIDAKELNVAMRYEHFCLCCFAFVNDNIDNRELKVFSIAGLLVLR